MSLRTTQSCWTKGLEAGGLLASGHSALAGGVAGDRDEGDVAGLGKAAVRLGIAARTFHESPGRSRLRSLAGWS
jgi:hypothetical protein